MSGFRLDRSKVAPRQWERSNRRQQRAELLPTPLYGGPGQLIRSRDGRTKYRVAADGSFRRVVEVAT